MAFSLVQNALPGLNLDLSPFRFFFQALLAVAQRFAEEEEESFVLSESLRN